MRAAYFVFDFDGVICDSNRECFVTSHRAWCDYVGRSEPGELDFSSEEFSIFKNYRAYIKGGGQYYVFWRTISDGKRISSQREMDDLSQKWAGEVGEYRPLFYSAREVIRDSDPVAWLKMHQVYPEVAGVFSRLLGEGRAQIATLKDKDSVTRILGFHGINVPAEKVLDQFEISTKLEALDAISESIGKSPSDICFIDDNVTHLLEPQSRGYNTVFADWGYHTPEHLRLADTAGLRKATMQELEYLITGAGTDK